MFLDFEQIWANIMFYMRTFLSSIYLIDNFIWQFDQLFLVPWYSKKISIYLPKGFKMCLHICNHLTSAHTYTRNLKAPLKMSLGRSWNCLYQPVMNGLDNAVKTDLLSWKIKFSVNGRLLSRKSSPKFYF